MDRIVVANHHTWNQWTGGTERFTEYLREAIGCDVRSPADPHRLGKYEWVISNADLGLDWASNKICFFHGLWKQLHVNLGITSGTEEERQRQAAQRKDVYLVAASNSVASQLECWYQVSKNKIRVISHGIPLDVWRPALSNPKSIRPRILHVATDIVKAREIIPVLQRILPDFDFVLVYRRIGLPATPELYQRGDIFLHLSRYEGNSYACMEALACGLPSVLTDVGFFAEGFNDWEKIGMKITIDTSLEDVARAILTVYEQRKDYAPREVAEKYFDFRRFKQDWVSLLMELDTL